MNENEIKAALQASETIGNAIAAVWARPDASVILDRFVAGRLTFRIDVHGLRFEEDHELPGQYL